MGIFKQSGKYEELLRYIKGKIVDAPIDVKPFAHVVISPLIPASLYRDILSEIPEIFEYQKIANYPGNETLIFNKWRKVKLLEDLRRAFVSQDFANLLQSKFGIEGNPKSNVLLHKDLDGFEIRPHTDVKAKKVTYLCYLARDESMQQLGTYLCLPKNKTAYQQGSTHYSWDDFVVAKTIQYNPNTFLAFAPGDSSFHAVKLNFPLELHGASRDVFRGFLFDKNSSDLPRYMRRRHQIKAFIKKIVT